jgi:hypothetical protein
VLLNKIVSRDRERLKMVLLDRTEVHMIPLDVYFYFKLHFNFQFFSLKKASVRLRFGPGLLFPHFVSSLCRCQVILPVLLTKFRTLGNTAFYHLQANVFF